MTVGKTGHRTARRISRRALLRGTAGAALALPWLELMVPREARGAATSPPLRTLFIYFPTGYKNGNWLKAPAPGVFSDIAFPATAAALMPFKDQLSFITGTGNAPAAVGNGGDGIHARGTGCSLTCEVLTKNGFTVGVSADQLIAKAVGSTTCVPSLALGIPGERLPGFNEDGYGEVYLDNVSFTGPRTAVQKDRDPQALFNRLIACSSIGQGGGGGMPDPLLAERSKFEAGVMSAVKDEANRLLGCVGKEDRLRLQQYYTSVSELEQRFQTTPMGMPSASCATPPTAPPKTGATYAESIHLMMDTLVFAFQCGLTRVSTLMMDGAFSRRNYNLPELNGADYIHGLSHAEISHDRNIDHPRWVRITTHFFENFAYLLQKMTSIQEGDRTMLGNSIVYINSEFGDGDAHNQFQLPAIVAGNAGGKFKSGQHIALPDRTPVSNILLTILQTIGLSQDSFGDSKGPVTSLLA
jgi:hypothetical protein